MTARKGPYHRYLRRMMVAAVLYMAAIFVAAKT